MSTTFAQRSLSDILLQLSAGITDVAAGFQEDGSASHAAYDVAASNVYHDPSAFVEIFDRYYSSILQYLYRRNMDHDAAEDLTSQTFIRAFEYLTTAPRRVLIRPWLYRVATNLHLSEMRRSVCWRKLVPKLWSNPITAAPTSNCDGERVRSLLLELPEKYRTVLMLRYDEELGYDEIAEVLQIALPSVRSRVSRGLKELEARWKRADAAAADLDRAGRKR